MLGNISKKKGDNGDFYTKAVVDKKIKDAETAVRAYTDKAAADAKNDLYAEVGEKVGAVEETVKAKLDSTDTKLDTKVDKVSGKSLIDSGVADNLKYDTDKEEILIKVSEPSQGLRVKSTAFSESTQITSGSIEIESDASGLGNYLSLSPFGGIMINTPTTSNADIRLVTPKGTHKLSEKANTSDLANKVDKVNGKSLVDATDIRAAVQNGDLTFADMKGITLRKTLSQETEDSGKIETSIIVNGEEITASLDVSENPLARHSASFWYGGIEVESGFKDNLNGVSRLTASDITVSTPINGKNVNLTANDVEIRQNVTAIHKLSEKANASDIGVLSDLTTTDKSSVVAAINEVKSIGGGDVLDNLTYDSTNDIINSSANLLLENSASVAAYNGTFRGDIKIGQLGANKWAYRISPITGFSTSVDVTCTSGNVVHNLASKADTTNVLTRNNTQTFTPTGDYQPATKKYVDDAIAALKLDLGLD